MNCKWEFNLYRQFNLMMRFPIEITEKLIVLWTLNRMNSMETVPHVTDL